MEAVRKGRGLTDDDKSAMVSLGVPDWYIDSCRKIKYLFPKAHAVAYVMMGFRVAWFKVHHPLAFYAVYFYIRSQKGAFDALMMTKGDNEVTRRMRELKLAQSLTGDKFPAKDSDSLTTLESVHEFYMRGFSFGNVDLYKSAASKFEISGDRLLLPPLCSVAGLGETAAQSIVDGRAGREFTSAEELVLLCPKVTKAHVAALRELGTLSDIPDEAQMSFFD